MLICLKGNWLCHIVFNSLHLYFSITGDFTHNTHTISTDILFSSTHPSLQLPCRSKREMLTTLMHGNKSKRLLKGGKAHLPIGKFFCTSPTHMAGLEQQDPKTAIKCELHWINPFTERVNLTLTPEDMKQLVWTLGAGDRAPWAVLLCLAVGLPEMNTWKQQI